MKWKVPFFDLELGETEKQAAISVIESNWLTSGPKISEFEEAFSLQMDEQVSAVAVSSGTAALHLSLLALGVGEKDEVILPSLTFVACANAVLYVGATPIFADINSELDWNISPTDVEKKITNRTKAIMVVHYAGYPCQMDAFVSLSEKYNLFLIEDCSHATLGRWQGKSLGTFGDTGCFSFFSNKNITTGEGGMITTKDPELAQRLRTLRTHGITSSTYERFKGRSYEYDVKEVGFNYRMDEIRAAIGIAQIKRLSGFSVQRKKLTKHYHALLKEKLPQVIIPFLNQTGDCCYHIFPILLPNVVDRNKILQEMNDKGIQCSVHYRPIHTLSAYSNVIADIPQTEQVSHLILTLPLFASLTLQQVEYVVDSLEQCLLESHLGCS